MHSKICFKCGIEKPITDYYVHKQMGDGHLNKCKNCTKNDVGKRYEKLANDESFIEKERLRGRIKYAKYKYKHKNPHSEGKCTARDLRAKGINLKNKEIHHWNYNFKNDVFILSPRAHKLIHKYILFDEETKLFKYNYDAFNGQLILHGTTNRKLIRTKREHFLFMLFVFKHNNVNYEIDVYPQEEKP